MGTKFQTGFGGKGANQCAAAAKLGGKIAFIARVYNFTIYFCIVSEAVIKIVGR